ncbi:MAG: pyridoxal phosphate-dependent aminotransferase [Deltaproteobacteria bacterium]|nr:pyridoxal phosphate-dependent aminotransferase [Deltaproteobacteria bacterium]
MIDKVKLPHRASEITPFLVMDILEKAKKMEAGGEDIVHLEVGEPDFDTPLSVREAAKEAIDRGQTGYAPSLGLPELREIISEDYNARYGVNITSERVIITSGSSPALQMIFASLINEGDEVIMSNPHYACYENFVKFFGGHARFVDLGEKEDFRLKSHAVSGKISKKTRAILVNSPANPTGVVLSGSELESICNLNVPVISDEIYHGLTYEGDEHSVLEFSDDAFVVNGFSKRYAMTGWRLGYAIVPHDYIRPLQRLIQNFFISAPTISQWGGLAALKYAGEDLQLMKEEFRKRRDYIVEGLGKMGLKLGARPEGAFYVLVNVKDFTNDSLSFCYDLLDKGKVALTPGIDFGSGGEGYVRLSYANSIERIGEGLQRIGKYLEMVS